MSGTNLTYTLFLSVLIVGGAISWGFIPQEWLQEVPGWVRAILVVCLAVFSVTMFVGFIMDTGIVQRLLRKK